MPRRSPVYDCLLDDYEKGMTAARLDEIFGQVTAGWGCATEGSSNRGTQTTCLPACLLRLP